MTTATAKLESLKRTITLMSRILDNMTGDDYEEQDAMRRAIRDAEADVFELELELNGAAVEVLETLYAPNRAA
jgi:hypothetical protein